MTTKLYFVQADDENGESLSAIVEAIDPDGAVAQWERWLIGFLGDSDEVEWNTEIPECRIFELPEKVGRPGFFQWHTHGGVIEHKIEGVTA